MNVDLSRQEALVRVHNAIANAKQLADFILTIGETRYPGFHSMTDARACAMLLREETGKLFYAREHEATGTTVYYVG